MAQEIINVGQPTNSNSGDTIRVAFTKVNANFTELYNTYSLPTASSTITGGVKVGPYLTMTDGVLSVDFNNIVGSGLQWNQTTHKIDIVGGVNFNLDLSNPPIIGGITPNTGKFTILNATGAISFNTTTHNQTYQTSGAGVIDITSGSVGHVNNMIIGDLTPASATFTNLTVDSTVSGAGISNYFATKLVSPSAIGSIAPNTGAFTTLTASSVVSGTGFDTFISNKVGPGLSWNNTTKRFFLTNDINLASPGPIGGATANSGYFTSLSATNVVSGTGFDNYIISKLGTNLTWDIPTGKVNATVSVNLASPGAIGGTVANTGAFTNLSASGSVSGAGFENYIYSSVGNGLSWNGVTKKIDISNIIDLRSPSAIGSLVPSTGAFSTLSASSTVSGAGFDAYVSEKVGPGLSWNGSTKRIYLTSPIDFSAPGPIGGSTASSGAFTILSASSSVSGTGFDNFISTKVGNGLTWDVANKRFYLSTIIDMANPAAIGNITPNSGAFTSLSASTTVGGVGFELYIRSKVGAGLAWDTTNNTIKFGGLDFSRPASIGNNTPNSGAFTTLSANSTVSGDGFDAYINGKLGSGLSWNVIDKTISVSNIINLSNPGAIGNSVASSGAFTTLSASSTISGPGFDSFISGKIGFGLTWNANTKTINSNIDLTRPTSIGNVTPNTAAFTDLMASGVVSGDGFDNYVISKIGLGLQWNPVAKQINSSINFSSPPVIGNTTPNSAVFTSITSNTLVSGAGFDAYINSIVGSGLIWNTSSLKLEVNSAGGINLSRPGPIGGSTASTAIFTDVTASGIVSGVGFDDFIASKTGTGLQWNTATKKFEVVSSGSINLSSPGRIGNTTPNTGAFTDLSASGIVNGVGFDNYMSVRAGIGMAWNPATKQFDVSGPGGTVSLVSPGPIGGTTPNSGAFTTLSASSVVSGAGFETFISDRLGNGLTWNSTSKKINISLTSPGAIGGTTASSGAFTTLSASSTVSGNGFDAFVSSKLGNGLSWDSINNKITLTNPISLASPGPIGGTTASAGTFTSITASSTVGGTGFDSFISSKIGDGLNWNPTTKRINVNSVIDLSSPGQIGEITPNSGAFTILSANTSVSGDGFDAYISSKTGTGLHWNTTSKQIDLVLNLSNPGAIGNTTANTGTFTDLAASGVVSGAGFNTFIQAKIGTGLAWDSVANKFYATSTGNLDLTSPSAVGSVNPNTGAFTDLSATGVVSGAGFDTFLSGKAGTGLLWNANAKRFDVSFTVNLASPGAIGNTTASTGAFTDLSATGTVGGTGFNTYVQSKIGNGLVWNSTTNRIDTSVIDSNAPIVAASNVWYNISAMFRVVFNGTGTVTIATQSYGGVITNNAYFYTVTSAVNEVHTFMAEEAVKINCVFSGVTVAILP